MISTPTILAGAGGLGLGLGAAVTWGITHPRSQLFGQVIWRGPATGDSVALTFDDGPHPEGTPAILDALAQRDVTATFFVVGQHVERFPDLVRRMADEGHTVVNHSYDHAYTGLFGMTRYWRDQIRRTADAIEKLTDARPKWYRPPMGFSHWHMLRAARIEDHQTVTWTRRGRDGVATTAAQIQKRLHSAVAGDILLLHDGVDPNRSGSPAATVASIGPIVEALQQRGLSCVRLDALLKASDSKPATKV